MCHGWLAQQRAEIVESDSRRPDRVAALMLKADGLIVRTYTQVDAALLDHATGLRVVGRAGVGLDNIDLVSCRERGVQVVHTPDANTQAVAEYVVALILDHMRPRPSIGASVTPDQFHQLRREQVGTQLDRLTLGILGFGRIGSRLGRLADGIGMRILVHDLLPEEALRDKAPGVSFEFVPKKDLYAQSDVLSIHVDGRRENRHLIGADALRQLQPSCLLINTSRGMVIDTAGLGHWAAAHGDQGAAAILDVHDPEPPDEDCPLFGLPNVRLLPHLASRTDVAMQNMSWVVKDVMRVLEGRRPACPAWV